jgi:hypothetical protein
MIEIPELHYRRMAQPIADDVGRIRRFVAQENIKLIIVDSLGLACGGEPESAEVALRMYGALRQLNCTILGIHHISASQTEQRGKRRPFGSVYHVNIPRSTWEVRSTPDTETNSMRVGLYHRKSNNGRLWKETGYEFRFETDATLIKRTDIMGTPELAEGVSQKDQVKAVLVHGQHGQLTSDGIADITGLSPNTVRAVLSRYKAEFEKDGQFWRVRSNYA